MNDAGVAPPGVTPIQQPISTARSDVAQNFGNVIGPAICGQIIAAGGFAAAGPWSSFVGLIALLLAWRFLPGSLAETERGDGPILIESL